MPMEQWATSWPEHDLLREFSSYKNAVAYRNALKDREIVLRNGERVRLGSGKLLRRVISDWEEVLELTEEELDAP
jgi:hypothetical protein